MKQSHKNLSKIIALLHGQAHQDGTSIGDTLNMTRAGVWKAIQKLESYGIPIQSSKGKGYLLEEPCILLDDKKIKSLLQPTTLPVILLEKIDSTNDYLKNLPNKPKKPTVCLAEMQTQGKGRLGRAWHSPFGQNIYFSLLYPLQKDTSELSGLSLVVGLAIAKAIENSCALTEKIFVKWPNDIIADNKKLSGTLIEIEAESHGFSKLIIGIGINVNMQEAAKKQIDQAWTSIRALTGLYQDRNQLCAELINQLMLYLEKFISSGLNPFMKEWEARDYLLDQSVHLKSNDTLITGIGQGITQHGQLVLRLPNGSKQAFSSGDTSLLKK